MKMTSETNEPLPFSIYELSVTVLVSWQAHAISNAGNNGSNRLLPRRQLLADGSVTDACSGSILKHKHATQAVEYFAASACPLCPACRMRDGRRAAALQDDPVYGARSTEQIVSECALCDTHGFLVTAKNASQGQGEEARRGKNKHSLIEFSYALARPGAWHEEQQVLTRIGTANTKEEGQMLMKTTVRSGDYALTVRYTCAGIGTDTHRWQLAVTDGESRIKRHRAVLQALRDVLISPDGALTAATLPHLTGLQGVLVLRTGVGRAPCYSALDPAFMQVLQSFAGADCQVIPFETVADFYVQMNTLIASSSPALHPSCEHV